MTCVSKCQVELSPLTTLHGSRDGNGSDLGWVSPKQNPTLTLSEFSLKNPNPSYFNYYLDPSRPVVIIQIYKGFLSKIKIKIQIYKG